MSESHSTVMVMPESTPNRRREDAYAERLSSIEVKIDECSNRIHRNEFAKAVERLEENIKKAVINGDERLKSLEGWRESKDLEDKRRDLQMEIIQNYMSRSEARDSQLQDSINAMHVTINRFSSLSPSSAKQAAKSPVVWTISGIVVVVQLVVGIVYYLASGDPTILESVK